MRNDNTTYEVLYEDTKPVLVTSVFIMNDGEVIRHVENMEFEKAEAIAIAYIKTKLRS